ncbi:hypothetical protein, variant [Aphanomyces astaci]|uniref:RING-type domain-containing protein n=1 Tax=Aphanomyces astaci TaxID=112090 RepID=W4GYW6_APHAT|nr:hypothetical protein, variant [Aphanomyces astaci]ETV84930.1 hypothetical protein, variant [Aphanomyces astaci]|eukprot:XP_009824948.1 hypothetical protein, variant [Aphanomyces astaci]
MGNDIPNNSSSGDDDLTFIDDSDILLSFADDDGYLSDDETVLHLLSPSPQLASYQFPNANGPRPHQPPYGRTLALLSSEHQRWYQSRDVATAAPKPLMLFAPSQRKHVRTRASSLSSLSSTGSTFITSSNEPEPEPGATDDSMSMSSRLQESLARNLHLANDVQRLSRDYEMLTVQFLQSQGLAHAQSQAVEREMQVNRKLTRKLDLVTERYRVANEGYAALKKRLNGVRVDLRQVVQANENLTGNGSYRNMSVAELEVLETTLEGGLAKIREAMRQQYRDVVEGERETCVVCLHEKVSIVLLPCRHRVLCATCAVRVHQCPVDRMDITDRFSTFGM